MIGSLHKAFRVLELLADDQEQARPLGVIAARLGLNKATCAHVLKTLSELGYVEQLGPRQGYRLGPMAYALTRGRPYRRDLVAAAEPLMTELARQVGDQLGRDDAVLVFDPSGFPKKGTESVGVQRQWCGRLGKVENCQVGVYMGYVSAEEHALVDVRLYLPKSWATDRRRRKKCRVSKGTRYKTRHQLALDMLDQKGHLLPHAWVAGDDEMGRSSASQFCSVPGVGKRWRLPPEQLQCTTPAVVLRKAGVVSGRTTDNDTLGTLAVDCQGTRD